MDINDIRKLLREGHSVVLVEQGQPPLVVTELADQPPVEEVQISSRWPKGRSIHETVPAPSANGLAVPSKQDQVLERLNKEILALKAQIAQDENGAAGESLT